MSTRKQGVLVPYVFDNRPPVKRGHRMSKPAVNQVGGRNQGIAHGGGGPENFNATPANSVKKQSPKIAYAQNQPSWRLFEDDFYGPAAPSTTPHTYATTAQPSNSFRLLGDAHGGRQ